MIKKVKMKKVSHIFIVLLIITEFKPLVCHEVSDLQTDGKTEENSRESTALNVKRSDEKITSKPNFNYSRIEIPVLKENRALNKSIEYLIEGPNYSNNSHNQEVIIKPLNEFSANLEKEITTFNNENEQKLAMNLTIMENQTTVSIVEELVDPEKNLQIENINSEPQKEEVKEEGTPLVYEKKEKLIINLLSPPHSKVTMSMFNESNISSNKSDIMEIRPENQTTTDLIKETNQILKDHLLKESTITSIKMRINPLNQILKFLTKESAKLSNNPEQELFLKHTTTANQSIETPNNQKKEDFIPEPVNLQNQYTVTIEKVELINSTNNHVLVTTPDNFKDHSTESQINEIDLSFDNLSNKLVLSNAEKSSDTQEIEKTTVSLLQSLISPSLVTKSEEEEGEDEESTTKSLTTLEDYAVKQMNFILDHMLLESHEFVAKVLQATGNTIFQRDHLKRYAENINLLLNPQLESDYSEDINDSNPVARKDLYEEVVKKLNFFKSQATKQLQKHLPADWVKDYKDTKEELKIWLDKASNDMHREFNLYLNEEYDHIKYLYFNEAFDDIIRATEIHQKLALLADLIKIVKNKKQITFMDLYMQ